MLNNIFHYTKDDYEAIKILEDFLPEKIFDAHAHLFDTAFLPTVHNPNERLIADFKTYFNGISPLVCNPKKFRLNIIPYPDKTLAIEGGEYLKSYDDFIVSELKKNPDNVGEIMVTPGESADSIEKRLVHPSIRGLKCYHTLSSKQNTDKLPPEDYLSEGAWQVAQKHKMCITLHLVRDKALSDEANINYIKTMVERYPEATLILAHCGRAFAAWTGIEAIEEFISYENVFFDLSAVCESPVMAHLFNKIGVDRCMWGSDFPEAALRGKSISVADTFVWLVDDKAQVLPKAWLTGIENLMAVRQACILSELSANSIEKIFWGTASNLWSINR